MASFLARSLRQSLLLLLLSAWSTGAGIAGNASASAEVRRLMDGHGCPGTINVDGFGPVALVNAYYNTPGEPAGVVNVEGGSVVPHMSGRAYFADSCNTFNYDHARYKAMKLLGMTMRYKTDLSQSRCGCNAAIYLTSLHQNEEVSACNDYYCDANSVCGLPCAEIDMQEANLYAWSSTLHVYDDGRGARLGYGGSGPRDWSSHEYGPNAKCINTLQPFDVMVSFPVDSLGYLKAMEVTLTQDGSPCPLTGKVDSYAFGGRNGMVELSAALLEGMTPIISYWGSKGILWMDGKGADGEGPCMVDQPASCGDSARFFDFSVGPYVSQPVTTTREPPPVAKLHSPWMRVDSDAGVYYYNRITRQSTWTHPTLV